MSAKTKKYAVNGILFLIKLFVGLFIISPLLYCFFLSFMTQEEINTASKIIPSVWTLRNYVQTLKTAPLFKYFANSLVVCVIVIISTVLLSLYISAYAKKSRRNLTNRRHKIKVSAST